MRPGRKGLALIGGVFHLALELNDCLLENMEFEKFCSTVDTKHKIKLTQTWIKSHEDLTINWIIS